MKRLALFAFALVALSGCRAIVGIEDLSVASDSGASSSSDGAPMDVATDATLADSSGGDAGPDATLDASPADSSPPPADSMMPSADSAPPSHDAGFPLDSGYVSPCLGPVDGGCPTCCHSTYGTGAMDFVTNLFTAGCPCTASGSCYEAACGGSSCSMAPMTPSQACGMCINSLVDNAAADCPAAITACATSSDPASCTNFYQCVSMCPFGPPDGGP